MNRRGDWGGKILELMAVMIAIVVIYFVFVYFMGTNDSQARTQTITEATLLKETSNFYAYATDFYNYIGVSDSDKISLVDMINKWEIKKDHRAELDKKVDSVLKKIPLPTKYANKKAKWNLDIVERKEKGSEIIYSYNLSKEGNKLDDVSMLIPSIKKIGKGSSLILHFKLMEEE